MSQRSQRGVTLPPNPDPDPPDSHQGKVDATVDEAAPYLTGHSGRPTGWVRRVDSIGRRTVRS